MTKLKKSIAAQLIESMTEFAEALESDKPLDMLLTGHTVRLDLEPRVYSPANVRSVRKLLGASQSIFAQFIGVATTTVRSWEQGMNKPSGSAARLMDEIQSDPEHFRQRLRNAAVFLGKGQSSETRGRKGAPAAIKIIRRHPQRVSTEISVKHRGRRKSESAR